jgi:ATP-dependent Lhr-like helicase
LLARIHRLTIGRLRKEIEPVSAAEFMRFLFRWQHVAAGSRLHGEAGLQEVIRQMAGFEAAASAWERHLLPLRLAKYQPELLDRLCLSGAVMWGRLTAPAGFLDAEAPGAGRGRRIVPTSVAPISLFPREDAEWLVRKGDILLFHRVGRSPGCGQLANGKEECPPFSSLSPTAQDLLGYLRLSGASFFADLVRGTGHLPSQVEDGLWELATAGLVTADGFDNLRALLDPRRRRAEGRDRARRPRHAAGRWSLLRRGESSGALSPGGRGEGEGVPAEPVARQFLRRYGVVFRDLLCRETLSLPWRDLLGQYRRMELRGEIRGGRFVGGFTGEQFALPEALEALRFLRREGGPDERRGSPSHEIKISATDPLNLVGVILPGSRIPALPSNYVVFRDGLPVRAGQYREPILPVSPSREPGPARGELPSSG